MYGTLDSGDSQPSGLKRLARRDLPSTPRVPRSTPVAPPRPPAISSTWPVLTVSSAIAWVLSGWKWIVILALVGAVAGFGYSVVAKPKFTAYADLVVDPANLQLLNNDLYSNAFEQQAQLLDAESKLRVLTSGNVLTRVVTELNLQADPEFVGGSSLLDLSFLFGPATSSGDPVLTAVDALSKKVAARREERSYVVTLGVSSETADKSVLIANAMVAAFQTELAQAEADGATRAADALIERLSQLKTEVTAAESAVATFRQDHGLEAGNSGELINTQSMTLFNQRAIEAQQALITAKSRYSEMTDPLTGRANADAVQTPTMVALRTQYGLLKQQADAAATMYGPLHPTRASAERQLGGLQQQIGAEAARAIQTAKLELDQARSTVAELDLQTSAARDTVGIDGQAQVQLRDLERDAKAKADVYQAFMTRAREITERQRIDTPNIRIISPATPPSARSWPPRAVVTLGAGGAGGAALGIALALGLGFLAASRHPSARPVRGDANA